MRFLAWHVSRIAATPTEKGRSALVERAEPVSATNALLIFASFEKTDEPHPDEVVDKAATEIASIADQLKVTSIVLNPFAHLFAVPSELEVAKRMLDRLYLRLSERSYRVQKLAFGMFYELELNVKGHRLSRIARSIG